MATFLHMDQVRAEMARQFKELGYTLNISRDKTEITVYLAGNGITFVLVNGNPKKFEITLYGDKDDFNLPPLQTDHRWMAFERFRKTPDGVAAFIPWLAKIKRSHRHLLEIIEPSSLVEPFTFMAGEFSRKSDGTITNGVLVSVKISSIVTIGEKNRLIPATRPGSDAWFFAEIAVRGSDYEIITDGNQYYPVIKIDGDTAVYQIFTGAPSMERIHMMNSRDKALIAHACQDYIRTLVSVDKDKEGAGE